MPGCEVRAGVDMAGKEIITLSEAPRSDRGQDGYQFRWRTSDEAYLQGRSGKVRNLERRIFPGGFFDKADQGVQYMSGLAPLSHHTV